MPTDRYMTSAGLETIKYQNMMKQIRSTNIEIRRMPALVMARIDLTTHLFLLQKNPCKIC